MALSIVSDPIDNTLSKDPINYTIATGVSYVPLDALDLIIPTGADGAGDSFDYTINGITNNFAIPARTLGDTDLQYANAIATALANESLLFQLTTITVVDALHINIQAQAGLTISGAWVVGGTGGWYLSYPTAIPADGTMVAVWVVMGADNAPLLKVHDNPILLPMAENVAVEISNILTDNLLQANWLPDIPTCNQTTITENTITRKNYAIKFGQWQFGELLDLTQSTPKNVIFGGTGGWLDHITPHKPLLTATGELNKFLTHQPRKKLITHLQPEFLTWFHHEPAITDIQVHVIAYNGDGSVIADFYPTNLTYTVQYGHTYVIPVGIAATNVCVATPTAVYYKVEVVNAGNLTPISEQFTYIITPHTQNTRYYVFLNSLSGIDTIATNTRILMGLENNREIATRGYPNDPNPSEFGTMFTYNPDLSRSYELSTQLYSRCDVQWLQELLLQNAWAAELKYCQPCCGCPDDTAECYYIPIIVDNTMKIPISENGDVRIDWAYREETIHHSYPMDGCENIVTEVQRMKVSDYLHINSDTYADVVPLSYSIISWVINGNENITSPIISPTYSNSNVIIVAVQSPPYDTIPDYDIASCDVDTLFYTFMNQAAVALGISTYSFRESPLMHGNSYNPNPFYQKDYDRNTDNITPHPYYGCGFQIVRPETDTFSIVVECYYNGVYGHVMEFTETQCIINGITTAGVPTNGNIF